MARELSPNCSADMVTFGETQVTTVTAQRSEEAGRFAGGTGYNCHGCDRMATHFYKRFRMEVDLTQRSVAQAELPAGYFWEAWKPGILPRHAWAKVQSFQHEVDATVFECLSEYDGCLRLMQDIAMQPGFLPDATWLLCVTEPHTAEVSDCGTIQAVAITPHLASIQNVGVCPTHRGRHLGKALVQQCLAGCQSLGMRRVTLEVTAGNQAAVELYRQLGFVPTRTMYRTVEAIPIEL